MNETKSPGELALDRGTRNKPNKSRDKPLYHNMCSIATGGTAK